MASKALFLTSGIQSVGEIKLEGNPSDYDVLIGSTVNITCRVVPTPSLSCSTMWYKNSKRLTEQTKYGRIQWVLGQLISNRCSLTKLIIRNFSSSDAGEYKCLAIKTILKFQTDSEDSSSSIHINAGRSVELLLPTITTNPHSGGHYETHLFVETH